MIEQTLQTRRQELVRKQNENDLMERQARQAEDRLIQAAAELQLVTTSLEKLEEVANTRRGAMKGNIEDVLTEALQLVYGPGRSVELSYTIKNNRSHLAFEVVKETPDGEVRRVLDGKGAGLGVSDCVSVPLRLLVLLGSKQADRVCVLDECYKHIGPERVLLVVQFLKVLTERLKMQVILLSHHEMMRAEVDAAFHVREKSKGLSVVEAV